MLPWARPLGDGYSGIAVEGGVLYTGYRNATNDVIVALDAATGKTIWEFSHAAPFTNSYAEAVGPGPYAMPQVIGVSSDTWQGISRAIATCAIVRSSDSK